jgi:predicted peroxiredoxin
MSKLLIHVTRGPEDPSRASLAFLIGTKALAQGHEVTYFLAADAVNLMREAVIDNLVGLGTGNLRESYDTLVAGGAKIYVSGLSSKARGFEAGGPVEAVMPDKLVELVFEADRVLVY